MKFKIGDRVITRDMKTGTVKSVDRKTYNVLLDMKSHRWNTDAFLGQDIERVDDELENIKAKIQIVSNG